LVFNRKKGWKVFKKQLLFLFNFAVAILCFFFHEATKRGKNVSAILAVRTSCPRKKEKEGFVSKFNFQGIQSLSGDAFFEELSV
jgi:hypothetical protein